MPHRYAPNVITPGAMQAIEQVSGYIRQADLEAGLLDLVSLRVGQINGSDASINRHSQDLVQRGFPLTKLLHVPFWRVAGLFDERERAALAWVETVIGFADDEAAQAAHEAATAQFSAEELAELTAAVGLINLSNRLEINVGTAVTESGNEMGLRDKR